MILALALYADLTILDVLLAWVQPDPRTWPRRATHLLTEPPQALLRRILPAARTGGWDLSPLGVLALCGLLRLWFLQP